MKRQDIKLLKIAAAGVGLGIGAWLGLPKLLNVLGLHPHYKGRRNEQEGKR